MMNVEKREPSCTVGGTVSWCSQENSMEVPQKIKNRTALWHRHATFGHLFEEQKINNLKGIVDTCNSMAD